MFTIECQQGSAEWVKARLGIPTASEFHRILTPKTGQPSAQATALRCKLVAEWVTGEAAESYQSDAMARGFLYEQEAREWYEFTTERKVHQVGFVMRDDRMAGCSPDGFVTVEAMGNVDTTQPVPLIDCGGLEIKCMLDAGHMAFLLNPDPKVFWPQIQGTLWLTGRDWWDLLAYHPHLPSLIVRCERDEEYIGKLSETVDTFIERMMVDRRWMQEQYGVTASALTRPTDGSEAPSEVVTSTERGAK